MRRLCVLLLLALTLPGCFLVFEEHGKGGDDDDCVFPAGGGDDEPAPPPDPRDAVAPQRNPQALTCESFGGGGCNPECGPCPETTDLAPLPSWGFCFSGCEQLDETSCAADDSCRVIKDARCAVEGICLTDFLGCVATDQFIDRSVDCTTVTDADSCSRNPACSAYHEAGGCDLSAGDPTCSTPFRFCGPEGRGAGKCFEQAACDRAPPNCPLGTTPGVANGCFTDTCIPNDLCEPLPPKT